MSLQEPAGTETHEEELEETARIALLEAENRRLRQVYARSQRTQYRRTAIGLAVLGALAAVGGLVLPESQAVLFALAGIGWFGAVLTYSVTAAPFVPARLADHLYDPLAANQAAIATVLGLQEDRVYVPTDTDSVRLFVPHGPDSTPPSTASNPILTDPPHRGLFLETTGSGLFEAFEASLTDGPATDPAALGQQLASGLVDALELVGGATSTVDAAAGQATVTITDSTLEDVDRFDHPVASFLAVGFARTLDRDVHLEVTARADRTEWVVTCRWEPESTRE